MKSISKSLFTLLNTSVKITYPFNEIALIKKNDLNTEYDFYSDISLVLFTKYKDKMLKIWGSSHTPPTPQSYSEEILINLETKPELLHKVYHSFDGKILFKINDNFIENSIRVLLEKKGDYDQELKDINNRTQIGVLYPFGEIVQKIHLNQVRGVNICESLSRIYDYLGYRVQRFSCIQNSAHFHGILLSYLLEKKVNEELDFNGEGIKFEDLSSFLIEKKLKTEREIMAFGGEILQEISINEKMIKVFDKLNQMALEDLMLNYNAFITNKEHLTILDTYNLNKRTGKLIKDLVKKGKVLYREDIGYYIKIKKGSRVLNIMDPYNLLTKEGVFLGFLYEISSLHL